MSEVKKMPEKRVRGKRVVRLNVPILRETTHPILVGLQGAYQEKHRTKIRLDDMAGVVLEKTIQFYEP